VTAPGRSGGAGSSGNRDRETAGSSNVLRGALLVGVAVVLGLALLAKGFPESGGSSGAAPDATTTTTAAGGTTTSSLPAPHQPAEVKVFVLNGSGLVGVAGQATDLLNGKGYTTVPPSNTPNNTKVPATVVYAAPGYEADAQAIAADLGVAATAVQPMPAAGAEPAVPPDTQGANVVVVLGPDFKAG
jgi:hypothetical protein